ncbi:MAG: heme-binding protein [candidate division KSB1 bacterium]|nr:heme-binding protein [candidate division KSB1 bacterium]MDZ7365402.1 heme-binding protein [candidate division KSB1 bacterium]MDZ7403551.1 heme-binding protein [candidate division KSB1 bacterium]
MMANLPREKNALIRRRHWRIRLFVPLLVFVLPAFLSLAAFYLGCDSVETPTIALSTSTGMLEVSDVQTLIAHAVEQGERLGVKASIAITDREGNVLGVFNMNGIPSPDITVTNPIVGAIAKARTAAYLSSNQHGFSTLTACYITRNHFPPNIDNTAAGPLFGVPRSSIGGGDIQPNGDLAAGRPPLDAQGLTGVPGGVPIYKNNLLAGGIGVSVDVPSQAALDKILCCCGGMLPDETIALGAVLGGYETPVNLRGDGIFIDGIRFLFANTAPPAANFTLAFSALGSRGAVDARFPIRATPPPKFPQTPANELFREVNLGAGFDFRIRGGTSLTSDDVRKIITQAATQAAKTRAAIRRPAGVPAQVFIAVVNVGDGRVLGIGRTPDATLFSFDVSAQKARTALAFSDPGNLLGQMVRRELGLAANAGLAISSRAVGFLAQDFYPPGITREEQALDRPIAPGPFFIMPPQRNGDEFIFQKNLGTQPYGNGITIFPGGVPLYKGSQLVGGIGISGDGVDQDDLICFAGALGFEPPPEIRCDQFKYRDIRLPYVKFPRQPEIK